MPHDVRLSRGEGLGDKIPERRFVPQRPALFQLWNGPFRSSVFSPFHISDTLHKELKLLMK